MPWEVRKALETTKRFCTSGLRGTREPHAELCRKYAISRVTGYKLAFGDSKESGEAGLEELQPRAAALSASHVSGHRQPDCGAARETSQMGSRESCEPIGRLATRTSSGQPRAALANCFQREGLSHPRRKRTRTPPYEKPLQHAQAPNQVGALTSKAGSCVATELGATPDHYRAFSRYLLRVRIVTKPTECTCDRC